MPTDQQAEMRAADAVLNDTSGGYSHHWHPGAYRDLRDRICELILSQRQAAVAEDRAKVSPEAVEAAEHFMARWGMGKAITSELSTLLTRRERAARIEALDAVLKMWREIGTVRTIDSIEAEIEKLGGGKDA